MEKYFEISTIRFSRKQIMKMYKNKIRLVIKVRLYFKNSISFSS